MNIVILDTPAEIRSLFASMLDRDIEEVYRLRVAIDGDCFKFKVNEGCWSPPIGRLADSGGY